jgi:hypothetical protein
VVTGSIPGYGADHRLRIAVATRQQTSPNHGDVRRLTGPPSRVAILSRTPRRVVTVTPREPDLWTLLSIELNEGAINGRLVEGTRYGHDGIVHKGVSRRA